VKELDFLPEWYKDRRRCHCRMRKQYIALVAIFLMMMAFNLTATHRAARVAADLTRHEGRQKDAEAVVHEFDRVTKELNRLKTRASLVRRIDTRFDVAAILAEISHIVDESVALSRIALIAEPFSKPDSNAQPKGGVVRTTGKGTGVQQDMPLGDAKLRIALAGVAVEPGHVTDLVCRLDESSYFQQVRPSSYGKTTIPADPAKPAQAHAAAAGASASEIPDVTTFEITCYLANYTETVTQ